MSSSPGPEFASPEEEAAYWQGEYEGMKELSDEMEAEMETMVAAESSLREELRAAKANSQQAEDRAEKAEESLRRMEASHATATSKLEEAEEEVIMLRGELGEIQAERGAVDGADRDSSKDQDTRYEELARQVQDLERQLEAAQDDRAELLQLKERVASTTESGDGSAVAELQDTLASTMQEKQDLEVALQEEEEKADEMGAEIEMLTTDLMEKNRALESMKTIKSTNSDLESQVQDLANKAAALEEQLALSRMQSKEQLEVLEAQLGEARTKLSDAGVAENEAMLALKSTNERLEKQVEELKATSSSLEKQLAASSVQSNVAVEELQGQLSASHKLLSAAKAELAAYKSQAERESTSKSKHLQDQIDDLEQRHAELQQMADASAARVRDRDHKLRQLEVQLSEAQTLGERATTALAASNDAAEALKRQALALQSKLEAAEDNVHSSDSNLQAALAEGVALRRQLDEQQHKTATSATEQKAKIEQISEELSLLHASKSAVEEEKRSHLATIALLEDRLRSVENDMRDRNVSEESALLKLNIASEELSATKEQLTKARAASSTRGVELEQSKRDLAAALSELAGLRASNDSGLTAPVTAGVVGSPASEEQLVLARAERASNVATIRKLQDELAASATKLGALNDTIAHLESTNVDLTSECASNKEIAVATRSELTTKKTQLKEMIAQLKEMTAAFTKASMAKEAAVKRQSQIQAEVAKLRSQLTASEASLTREREASEKLTAELNSKISELEAGTDVKVLSNTDNSTNDAENRRLVATVEQLEAQVEDLSRDNVSTTAELEASAKVVAQLSSQVRALEAAAPASDVSHGPIDTAKVDSLQATIVQLEAQVADLSQENLSFASKLESAQAATAVAVDSDATAKAELALAATKVEQLVAEVDVCRTNLADKERRIVELSERLSARVGGDVGESVLTRDPQMEKELADAKSAIQELETRLAERQQVDKHAKQPPTTSSPTRISLLMSQLTAAESARQRAEEIAERDTKERVKAEKDARELKDICDAQALRIKQLSGAEDSLRKQDRELESQLSHLRDELEKRKKKMVDLQRMVSRMERDKERELESQEKKELVRREMERELGKQHAADLEEVTDKLRAVEEQLEQLQGRDTAVGAKSAAVSPGSPSRNRSRRRDVAHVGAVVELPSGERAQIDRKKRSGWWDVRLMDGTVRSMRTGQFKVVTDASPRRSRSRRPPPDSVVVPDDTIGAADEAQLTPSSGLSMQIDQLTHELHASSDIGESKGNFETSNHQIRYLSGMFNESIIATLRDAEHQVQSLRDMESEISSVTSASVHSNTTAPLDTVRQLRAELDQLGGSVRTVQKSLVGAMGRMTATLTQLFNHLTTAFVAQADENSALLAKVSKEQRNIVVDVRVRPPNAAELRGDEKAVVDVLSEHEIAFWEKRTKEWRPFAFDRVLGPDMSQAAVFAEVQDIAATVVGGKRGCIIAYGQTGAGKTFTMEGTVENAGINLRILKKLFALTRRHPTHTFSMRVGMLEVYNDQVRDLLGDMSSAPRSLDIRYDKDAGVVIPMLTHQDVETPEHVIGVLQRGNEARAVAATNVHEHSSRSHMILVVEVVGDPASGAAGDDDAVRIAGKLYLVDLAGSERVRKTSVQGQRMREAQHINKSLSALGDVLQALDRRSSHIPYRNSKLTRILQDALGGQSRTLMLCNVCPTISNAEETFFSLQFASRARRIELGSAQKTIQYKNSEKKALELRRKLEHSIKQRAALESELQKQKKDKKTAESRVVAVKEAERRSLREKDRTSHTQVESLRRTNSELSAKLRAATAKHKRDQEELRAAMKKIAHEKHVGGNSAREAESMGRKVLSLEADLSKLRTKLGDAKTELSLMRRDRQSMDATARTAELVSASKSGAYHTPPASSRRAGSPLRGSAVSSRAHRLSSTSRSRPATAPAREKRAARSRSTPTSAGSVKDRYKPRTSFTPTPSSRPGWKF